MTKRTEIAVSKLRLAKRREKAFMRDYRKRTMNDDSSAATAMTRARHVKSSFTRLCDRREIDGPMLQAAQEIDRVYMALTGALMAGSVGFEQGSRSALHAMPESIATAHAKRYKPWADELSRQRKRGGVPALEIVIDVVIDMRSLATIDAERGWGHGIAKQILRRALLEYAVLAHWAPISDLGRVARLRIVA